MVRVNKIPCWWLGWTVVGCHSVPSSPALSEEAPASRHLHQPKSPFHYIFRSRTSREIAFDAIYRERNYPQKLADQLWPPPRNVKTSSTSPSLLNKPSATKVTTYLFLLVLDFDLLFFLLRLHFQILFDLNKFFIFCFHVMIILALLSLMFYRWSIYRSVENFVFWLICCESIFSLISLEILFSWK